MSSPAYFSIGQRLGVYSLRLAATGVLIFLLLPIVVIVPLSFNAEPFFTFTDGMLRLQSEAYSLRWYHAIGENPNWALAIRNSFLIAILATVIATVLGTVAAVGIASGNLPYRRFITALLLSPMIVPLIIIAAGMFFFYSRFNLVGNLTGVVIAHAALGVPFVVVTVTATLAGFDRSLYNAGLSLGAGPLRTFRDVVFPEIRPGVVAGAALAFVTSFDEVVVVLFLAGPEERTIPRQMFSGLREQIDPTILAVATLLVLGSILLLAALELLRRRSRRLHGDSPHDGPAPGA